MRRRGSGAHPRSGPSAVLAPRDPGQSRRALRAPQPSPRHVGSSARGSTRAPGASGATRWSCAEPGCATSFAPAEAGGNGARAPAHRRGRSRRPRRRPRRTDEPRPSDAAGRRIDVSSVAGVPRAGWHEPPRLSRRASPAQCAARSARRLTIAHRAGTRSRIRQSWPLHRSVPCSLWRSTLHPASRDGVAARIRLLRPLAVAASPAPPQRSEPVRPVAR